MATVVFVCSCVNSDCTTTDCTCADTDRDACEEMRSPAWLWDPTNNPAVGAVYWRLSPLNTCANCKGIFALCRAWQFPAVSSHVWECSGRGAQIFPRREASIVRSFLAVFAKAAEAADPPVPDSKSELFRPQAFRLQSLFPHCYAALKEELCRAFLFKV